MRKMDETGKIIMINIQIIQLELGIKQNFWEVKFEKYKKYITTKCWITEIWENTNNIGITIKMENIGLPKDKNETTIMEIIEEIKWAEDKKES